MSAPAQIRRGDRLALLAALLGVAVIALLAPASSTATRPAIPAGTPAQPCPALGPQLRVKAPAKPVQAGSTVRVRARFTGTRGDRCYDVPMRICLRSCERGEGDLRVRRPCRQRGVAGKRISKTAVFTIRVGARARGSYRLVARAAPLRPEVSYRTRGLLHPRATAALKVRGD